MAYKYFPQTEGDIKDMLQVCGKKSLDELYDEVPDSIILKKDYNLSSAMSEIEIRDFFHKLCSKNTQMTCFAGSGFYAHYSPVVINHIISRSEFLTSYTPYQSEISQGTLQYIFEYQSLMAELTDMEVSNASMYDGTTATAEAMLMSISAGKKRNKVLISATMNPNIRRVVETYADYHGVDIVEIDEKNGETDKDDFLRKIAENDVAGVIVASPNYYGILEDYDGWADICHSYKSMFIMNCAASTLAVIKTPGELNADVAVGEAQSLGLPLSFGGPNIGYMCTKKSLMRKMPGRIVGITKDVNNKRTFVLTLQAREQHIRREKATSNICSNQSLMALYVTVYLSLMGNKGLREVNQLGYCGAHYLADKLVDTGKVFLAFPDKQYINEFAVDVTFDIDAFLEKCAEVNIIGGVKISNNRLLLCVTEMQSKSIIDQLVDIVRTI